MTKKMLTRALACLALLTLISSSLLAQDSRARYPQQAVAAHNSSSVVNPIEKVPSNCHKIAGNFGPSGDLYDSSAGYFVSGINNAITAQKQDIAIAFTPKADSTIVQAKLPLQYYGSGYNGATVAIYSDASGLPGTALSGATRDPKNFQNFGSGCCTLVVAWFKNGVHVKGGTQYWLVGTTDKKSMDSINTWDFIYNDSVGSFAFQQDDGGWLIDNSSPLVAFGIYGTTP